MGILFSVYGAHCSPRRGWWKESADRPSAKPWEPPGAGKIRLPILEGSIRQLHVPRFEPLAPSSTKMLGTTQAFALDPLIPCIKQSCDTAARKAALK